MNRLKAFTLVELLVGMIISAIIITICYYGYSIIYKQYIMYRKIKSEIVKTMQLDTILKEDFTESEITIYGNNVLFLIKKEGTINYEFKDSCILRIHRGITDTFRLTINDFTLHQLPISSGNVVDAFSFESKFLNEKQRFHFEKNYSAETLINTIFPFIENQHGQN